MAACELNCETRNKQHVCTEYAPDISEPFSSNHERWKAANYATAGMFGCYVYPASRAIDVSSEEAGHPAAAAGCCRHFP